MTAGRMPVLIVRNRHVGMILTTRCADVFAKNNFRKIVENALIAAKERSEELSKL